MKIEWKQNENRMKTDENRMKKVSVHFNSVHDTYLLADCIEKDIPAAFTKSWGLPVDMPLPRPWTSKKFVSIYQ